MKNEKDLVSKIGLGRVRNISCTINEARAKLTRLGMSLFYLYVMLAFVCCAGVFFGALTLIMQFAHIGTSVEISFLQVVLLILISIQNRNKQQTF